MAAEVADDLAVALQDASLVVGEMPVAHADRAQLRALLQNLVANATKFTRPDTPGADHRLGGAHRHGLADRGRGQRHWRASRGPRAGLRAARPARQEDRGNRPRAGDLQADRQCARWLDRDGGVGRWWRAGVGGATRPPMGLDPQNSKRGLLKMPFGRTLAPGSLHRHGSSEVPRAECWRRAASPPHGVRGHAQGGGDSPSCEVLHIARPPRPWVGPGEPDPSEVKPVCPES